MDYKEIHVGASLLYRDLFGEWHPVTVREKRKMSTPTIYTIKVYLATDDDLLPMGCKGALCTSKTGQFHKLKNSK